MVEHQIPLEIIKQPVHNSELKVFMKSSSYSNDELTKLFDLLTKKNSLSFSKIPGRNLFMAAVQDDATAYTGYENVWVRDNIHIAHAHYVQGDVETTALNVKEIGSFWLKYDNRWIDCIKDPHLAEDVMRRPHIRFNGTELTENTQHWSHAQNDAIGYWLWLSSKLCREGHLDYDILSKVAVFIALYFKKIDFCNDKDNGHWEEARKVEASSIGAATAGLRELELLLNENEKFQEIFEKNFNNFCKEHNLHEDFKVGKELVSNLKEEGLKKMNSILPFESRDAGAEREADGALLFLIYPLQIITGEMAQIVVDNVVRDLLGEHGIRRYKGDSYWMADYKAVFSEENRTGNFSEDIGQRNKHLKFGQEAQWCMFDAIVSCHYSLKLQDLQKRGASEAELLACKDSQINYFNRALGQITGEDCSFGPWHCPESYYIENGRVGKYVVNDITPLLWSQANLISAFLLIKKSL
ncbi:hypothetical protein HDU92_001523 [Lobulomyces angularis]|nr:hypothetical protein HDU92_001523 [Lobulomyces angularis]